ncbi:MAG: ferredoxin [Verrucomicrobiota bacterium]
MKDRGQVCGIVTMLLDQPQNVTGRFSISPECIDCDLCRHEAPNNIARDDDNAWSYVFKQPESEEEIQAILEGVEGCPVEAVIDGGD